jgi:hypothetical protein
MRPRRGWATDAEQCTTHAAGAGVACVVVAGKAGWFATCPHAAGAVVARATPERCRACSREARSPAIVTSALRSRLDACRGCLALPAQPAGRAFLALANERLDPCECGHARSRTRTLRGPDLVQVGMRGRVRNPHLLHAWPVWFGVDRRFSAAVAEGRHFERERELIDDDDVGVG